MKWWTRERGVIGEESKLEIQEDGIRDERERESANVSLADRSNLEKKVCAQPQCV